LKVKSSSKTFEYQYDEISHPDNYRDV